MRRILAAMSRLAVLVALLLLAAVPASASARGHHRCATWTRSGTLTNQTGQPIWMSDTDGRVPLQLVPTDGSVPFSETLPGSVRRHQDNIVMRSATPDWSSSQLFWLIRPSQC